MKRSGKKIACHNFNALCELVRLTGIPGRWDDGENHCQYRVGGGAVLNYWKTTGTITFQGPELAAAEVKVAFLKRAVTVQEQ